MGNTIKQSARLFTGYRDDPRNAFGKKGEGILSTPSANVRITRGGEVYTRLGYEDTGYDLAETGKAARSFYVKRYNVTFFCLNGKVKFVDHDNSDAVVDTGITLTNTTGKDTMFGEYMGDIYLTNTTDGLRQIHMARANGAASSGAASIKVDSDLIGRLGAFGDTTGTLRIATSTPFTEAYTGVNTSAQTITLTNTLDADVPDNTIVYTVEDISSGRPFASGITFWKERMVLWGVIHDENVDSPTNTVYMSKFALLTTIENIIDFDTAGTAAKEMVGKGGVVTNVISTRDYIYFFTETETYYATVSDVNNTTGGTPPQLLSTKYGCVNSDCSADMGNGIIVFLSHNNRLIAIRISTETGAAIVYPDESFDQDVRNTLETLDTDQSASLMFYHSGERLLYTQLSADSQVITFVYDNNIEAWLPPDNNKVFASYYERDGKLYATDKFEDTVYQINVGNTDDDQEIDCAMATGIFEVEDGRGTAEWKEIEISGSITQDTTIIVSTPVDYGTSTEKQILASDYGFFSARSFTDVDIGSGVIGGGGGLASLADWEKRHRIAPVTFGKTSQIILRSSGGFSWKTYAIKYAPLSTSVLTLQ